MIVRILSLRLHLDFGKQVGLGKEIEHAYLFKHFKHSLM